jgi:hypothetical protein
MDAYRYTREINALLRADVEGLTDAEKVELVRRQLALYEQGSALFALRLAFVPFVPGRRARDEVRFPGLGSSKPIGILGSKTDYDEVVLLYRLEREGRPAGDLPERGRLLATMRRLDVDGRALSLVPGWDRRPVPAARLSQSLAPGSLRPPSDDRADGPTAAMPEAWALRVDVEETFAPLRGDAADAMFGFASMFFERFRVDLELDVDGVTVASDAIEFEVFDESRFGSLYARVGGELLPFDARRQAEGLPVAYHPWFPVLCIGVEKANLYMKAIRGDVVHEKRMLTDPAWLLRVGLYLELLTCLGIVEVVKEDDDLLSPEEREIWARSPRYAELRRCIDAVAWRRVWEMRHAALQRTPGFDMPVGVQNLLRKRAATLGFLNAHHEDLKHAIRLAGPNLANAQETWGRVFRDAERAVLKMNREAFPELATLSERLRSFVLWHRQGTLAGISVPPLFTGPFGDQDGLFPSACRQYRTSMNDVARWAAQRELMEYTGSECVPASISLLENHIAGNHAQLARLQARDGYAAGLDVIDDEKEDPSIPEEQVAEMLGGVGLFQVLTDGELARVARAVRPITLGPHERIIVQGRKGSSLFLVYDGELEVVARDGADEKVLANLERGAIVGEMAFLTGQPRTATVRAVEGATVLEVSASALEPLARERPAIVEELTRVMQKRTEKAADPEARRSLFQRVSAAIFA